MADIWHCTDKFGTGTAHDVDTPGEAAEQYKAMTAATVERYPALDSARELGYLKQFPHNGEVLPFVVVREPVEMTLEEEFDAANPPDNDQFYDLRELCKTYWCNWQRAELRETRAKIDAAHTVEELGRSDRIQLDAKQLALRCLEYVPADKLTLWALQTDGQSWSGAAIRNETERRNNPTG